MKRRVVVVITMICVMIGAMYATATTMQVEGEAEFRHIGESLSEPLSRLLEEDALIDSGASSEDAVKYVGEIMGNKIRKSYFDIRVMSYASSPLNFENPEEKAWESLENEIWEHKIANEYRLQPTQEEIDAYVEATRRQYSEDEEGRVLIAAYIDGLGVDAETYWGYKRQYEAPIALIHANVEALIEKRPNVILEKDYIEAKLY